MILLIIFRVVNKREMAQATLFDFLIILLISNVVQNAMIGNDNSVLGAAVAVTLVLLSGLLNRVTARSRKARKMLEGQPVLLVQQGEVDEQMMLRQNISRNDLPSAIRKQGIVRMCEVAFAVLELDGSISVIKMDDDKRPHDCLLVEIAGNESADSQEGNDDDTGNIQHREKDAEHSKRDEEKR